MVILGLFAFYFAPKGVPHWKRHTTADGAASVEFPAPPEGITKLLTTDGVSVEQKLLIHKVPFKDISLILSSNPRPPGDDPNVPAEQRLAALKNHFAEQGFQTSRVATVQIGNVPGFELDLQQEGGKIRMWLRIAYAGGNAYQAVAGSGSSYHDDPIIRHFLDSFRIERTAVPAPASTAK